MPTYTRSEAAKKSGIHFETLRYYETRNLLTPSRHANNGYRLYDDSDLEKLAFIKQAQKCGFSLSEIAGVFELLSAQGPCATSSDDIIEAKIAAIVQKINELNTMKEMLSAYKPFLNHLDCQQIIADSGKFQAGS